MTAAQGRNCPRLLWLGWRWHFNVHRDEFCVLCFTVGPNRVSVAPMSDRRNEPTAAQGQDDPLAGLPDDLARVLRDPSIIVPQDAAVFELVAKWMDAPSNTASALTVEEWSQAWSVTCRRMLDAQAENERLRTTLARVRNNAEGWRGDDAAKGRALAVIAEWAQEALDV